MVDPDFRNAPQHLWRERDGSSKRRSIHLKHGRHLDSTCREEGTVQQIHRLLGKHARLVKVREDDLGSVLCEQAVLGEIPVRVALTGELCVHAQAPQGKQKRRHQFVYFNTLDFNLGMTGHPAGRNIRPAKISMGTASLVSSGKSIPVVLSPDAGQLARANCVAKLMPPTVATAT